MSGYCYRWDHKYDQHNIYVGSTKNDKERENTHRSDCHNSNIRAYNKPFYKYLRKYGTIEDWEMTVIYEGHHYELFEKNYIKSTWLYNLNERIPLPTEQEKKVNKEKIKKYREVNKDILYAKKREKIPCDNCGKFISRGNIALHKKSLKCRNFKNGNT